MAGIGEKDLNFYLKKYNLLGSDPQDLKAGWAKLIRHLNTKDYPLPEFMLKPMAKVFNLMSEDEKESAASNGVFTPVIKLLVENSGLISSAGYFDAGLVFFSFQNSKDREVVLAKDIVESLLPVMDIFLKQSQQRLLALDILLRTCKSLKDVEFVMDRLPAIVALMKDEDEQVRDCSATIGFTVCDYGNQKDIKTLVDSEFLKNIPFLLEHEMDEDTRKILFNELADLLEWKFIDLEAMKKSGLVRPLLNELVKADSEEKELVEKILIMALLPSELITKEKKDLWGPRLDKLAKGDIESEKEIAGKLGLVVVNNSWCQIM